MGLGFLGLGLAEGSPEMVMAGSGFFSGAFSSPGFASSSLLVEGLASGLASPFLASAGLPRTSAAVAAAISRGCPS